MHWFSRRLKTLATASPARLPHARPLAPARGDARMVIGGMFVCADCGRTDLPETGDWDPPICLECDAAINFDAERASADDDNHDTEDDLY